METRFDLFEITNEEETVVVEVPNSAIWEIEIAYRNENKITRTRSQLRKVGHNTIGDRTWSRSQMRSNRALGCQCINASREKKNIYIQCISRAQQNRDRERRTDSNRAGQPASDWRREPDWEHLRGSGVSRTKSAEMRMLNWKHQTVRAGQRMPDWEHREEVLP